MNLALVNQQQSAPMVRASMPPGMVIKSLEDAITIGKILAASRFFKDVGTEAQAVAKVLRGWELGIPPVASLENIYVIDGKTSLSAHLIAAKIKESGQFRFQILQYTDTHCEIAFFEKVDGTWQECGPNATFSLVDAERAELLSKKNWRCYPKAMLYARAMAQGARLYCASVFMGQIYVPEELDESDGVGEGSPPLSVSFQNNSEKIGDLLTELGINDQAERKEIVQRFLSGRKAANLTELELEAVLDGIRQSMSATVPVAEVQAFPSQPVAIPASEPITVEPITVEATPVAATPITEGNQSNRVRISMLLDQLSVQDVKLRQQLSKNALKGRNVENLRSEEIEQVLNEIQSLHQQAQQPT